MRPAHLLLLLVLAPACDLRTTNWCETPCGLWVADADRVSCEEIGRLEARAVAELAYVFPDRNLCARLSTFALTTVDTTDGTFDAWFGPRVYGWTSCLTMEIHVAHAPGAWERTALVHEMAHVAECPGANHPHLGWDERGVFDAIDRANWGSP